MDLLMIKKLKRAAEFIDVDILIKGTSIFVLDENDLVKDTFNPHQETGRHWLIEMMRDFDENQWIKYGDLMAAEHLYEVYNIGYTQWLLIAPSELCFEKIMEVID